MAKIYKRPWEESDFEAILAEFRPLMSKYIVDEDLAKPIDGAVECIDALRMAGILVGCDTGYYEEDSKNLNRVLDEKFGMVFDVVTNSEKVPGRPSPFMVFDCMLQAYKLTGKVMPVEAVVKIDDTAAGMLCGNNAGCWTIGLYASGSTITIVSGGKTRLPHSLGQICARNNLRTNRAKAAPRAPGQGLIETI